MHSWNPTMASKILRVHTKKYHLGLCPLQICGVTWLKVMHPNSKIFGSGKRRAGVRLVKANSIDFSHLLSYIKNSNLNRRNLGLLCCMETQNSCTQQHWKLAKFLPNMQSGTNNNKIQWYYLKAKKMQSILNISAWEWIVYHAASTAHSHTNVQDILKQSALVYSEYIQHTFEHRKLKIYAMCINH